MKTEYKHSEGLAGLGFLSKAAETKKRNTVLSILINSFNFKRFHANSYTYTKSFCSTPVREGNFRNCSFHTSGTGAQQ